MTVKINRETELKLDVAKSRHSMPFIFQKLGGFEQAPEKVKVYDGRISELYVHLKEKGYEFSEIIDISAGHYEVETTPLEKAAEYYKHCPIEQKGFIEMFLNIAEIKVDGVNV